MNEEKDFFKTCFNTVAGLEVKNESEAIAKEVVLSEIENLQQENNKLQNNWNELKNYLEKQIIDSKAGSSQQYYFNTIYKYMQEMEQGKDD